jgi:uncharacterized membrane protein
VRIGLSPGPDSPTSTGLPPHVAAVLAYAAGCLSCVVMLILEKKNTFVRFHAWQSTLVFGASIFAMLLVRSMPVIGSVLYAAGYALLAALWILLMFKAAIGERFHLPYAGEIAERQIR